MAKVKRSLRGEYMESCNCDYLCPCIFTNPQEAATHDHCTAVMVFRIDEGQFSETKLDGLKFALVIRSGRVMADGNWIFAGVVDASADDLQRDALGAIVAGDAGGTPALIRAQPRKRPPRGRVQANRRSSRRAQALGSDPRYSGVRDRRRCFPQPQRGPALYRQYCASSQPPPGPRPFEGNACRGFRP